MTEVKTPGKRPQFNPRASPFSARNYRCRLCSACAARPL